MKIAQPGDVVYVKFSGQWCRYIVQRHHPELGGSYTIQNGVGTATCGVSDAVPQAEHFERKLKAEEPEARERLAKILEAHAAGHLTVKAIAEFLKVKQISVRGKFNEAVRRGFIPAPEPPKETA